MMESDFEKIIQQKEILILSRPRFLMLKFFFVAFFVVVAIRLINIQLIDSKKYKEIAKKQYEKKFVLPAIRGNIYDRNDNILVSNTMYVSFAADPKIVGNSKQKVAETFSHFFKKPASFYLSKLHEKDEEENLKRFVWLERRVNPEMAKRIKLDKLEGVVVINEPKRLYHYDELASTLLGFTNIDNVGISGIEFQYDGEMKGTDGFVVMQRDGMGRVRPSADYPRRDPEDGKNIYLTIDLTYQAIVDEELRKGVENSKADGGFAVILNPKTGEVIALSVFPAINPNDVGNFDIAYARNRVVSDIFEPGSVFKLVTASAAYENGLVKPDSRFNAEHGKMKVMLNNKKFIFINDSKEYDYLTFKQAIEVSSNIVMAKVGKMLGGENIYRQARRLGYGMSTCIDLPGEARGILKKPADNNWSGTTVYAISYGYEIGATPIQIACSYAAIANNGVLMRPYVLSKIQDKKGKIFEQNPQAIRRVASKQTIEWLKNALESVVERGTAKDVYLEGIRIAGKTGTARKYEKGRYVSDSYITSFVGFFPVEDPQVVCLVMLDNPRNGYYGGVTCGPVFKAIAERIIITSYKFSRETIKQELIANDQIVVPDVRMLRPMLAQKILATYNLNSQIFGHGLLVIKQSPEPGKKIEKEATVCLILDDKSAVSQENEIIIPDVRGMSVRRAMNRLMSDEFQVKIEGSGVVVSQLPNAGEKVQRGASVKLICGQRNISQLNLN